MTTKVISVRVPKKVSENLKLMAMEEGHWTASDLVKDWIRQKMIERWGIETFIDIDEEGEGDK